MAKHRRRRLGGDGGAVVHRARVRAVGRHHAERRERRRRLGAEDLHLAQARQAIAGLPCRPARSALTTSNGAEARTRSPKGGSKTGGAAHTPSNRSPSTDVESANVSLESPCSTADRMRVFSPRSKTTSGPVPRRWSVLVRVPGRPLRVASAVVEHLGGRALGVRRHDARVGEDVALWTALRTGPACRAGTRRRTRLAAGGDGVARGRGMAPRMRERRDPLRDHGVLER
jgi:hypothetical protein